MVLKDLWNVDKVEAAGRQRFNVQSFVSCALLYDCRAKGFSADVLLPSAIGDMCFDQVKVNFLYNNITYIEEVFWHSFSLGDREFPPYTVARTLSVVVLLEWSSVRATRKVSPNWSQETKQWHVILSIVLVLFGVRVRHHWSMMTSPLSICYMAQ